MQYISYTLTMNKQVMANTESIYLLHHVRVIQTVVMSSLVKTTTK